MKRVWIPLLVLSALFASHCGEAAETRVARVPLRVFETQDAKKRLTSLSKGEKVELVEAGEKYSRVRLADGKEGWSENKYLAIYGAVVTSGDATLYRRPSSTSGQSSNNKNMILASVVFIEQQEENEEGKWLSIRGGHSGKWISGWIKEGQDYSTSLDLLGRAITLEEAIIKKDVEALEELSGAGAPIGEAAAGVLVELQPPEGEEDADMSDDLGDGVAPTPDDADSPPPAGAPAL